MAKQRVKIPLIGPLDTGGDKTSTQGALSSISNGYVDINADGSAIIRLRPLCQGSFFDLTSDLGSDGPTMAVAWDQVRYADEGPGGGNRVGWFLVFSENQNAQTNEMWLVATASEPWSGFPDNSLAFYGTIAGAGDGRQAPSWAFYYDRTYGDADIAFVTTGDGVYKAIWDGSSTPPTNQQISAGTSDAGGLNLLFKANSVAAFRGYIVVSDGDLMVWSDLNDYKSFPATNVAGADQLNDRIIDLITYRNELVVGGSNSIEFWQLTGQSGANAIAPTVSATLTQGVAPDSNMFVWDDVVYFVNNRYQVMALQNRQLQVLSKPIDNVLAPASYQVSYVFKVSAFYVGDTAFLAVKRTSWIDQGVDAITYVMNIENGIWSNWGQAETQSNGPGGFFLPATSANNAITLGRNEGDSTKLDRLFPPSVWGTFDPIGFGVSTMFLDHGSLSHKIGDRLMVRFPVGSDTNTKTVRVQDDDTTPAPQITLDNISSENHVEEFIALGRYRTRKYIVSMSCTVDGAIGMAEEVLEYQDF